MKIFVCLVVFIVGFILGWLARTDYDDPCMVSKKDLKKRRNKYE